MLSIIKYIALINITPYPENNIIDHATCPWRSYLDTTGLDWRDLNYSLTEDKEEPLVNLRTWLDMPEDEAEKAMTVDSYPFVIATQVVVNDDGSVEEHCIYHTNLDELKSDKRIVKNNT